MIYEETFYCPSCEHGNKLKFEYYRPDNKDQIKQDVKCKCGKTLDCMIEFEVRTEVIAYHPEIVD